MIGEKYNINLSVNKCELIRLLQKQLVFFCVDSSEIHAHNLERGVEIALSRVAKCFSKINNKYYVVNRVPQFNPFHTGQYAIFLYYLSHSLCSGVNEKSLSEKVYALNKMLHCIDIFYEVELPDIFYLDHPVGSVIGRAKFSDYFQFRQNCTVGNNRGIFPRFGRNVHLWSGVSVIGNCDIGDNVIFSSGTFVKDEDIPSNSVVFGRSPNLVIKDKKCLKRNGTNHFIID